MQSVLHARDAFAPPSPPGRARALALALLAHVFLIAALTWGVNWKSSAEQPAVEAELWSAVPQQAAPRAVTPPPRPAAEPTPEPKPAPAAAPRPAQDDAREAEIALEKKRLEQKRHAERLAQEKKEQERRERLEQEKRQKAQREQEQREKELREKKLAEQRKLEQQKAEQKKLAEAKRQAEAEEQRAEELRQEQLRRIAGLAGASGGESASGTALRSSGPSGSYGGRVAAKVRPNIVYPDTVSGNPRAEVEVRAAPDGTITGVRLTQSSGNKAWDSAVVRALYKTETLPRDVDGRVPSSLVIGFRPKD